MKKLLALILALLMAMTVFAGCGDADSDDISSGETNSTVEPFCGLQLDAFFKGDETRLFKLVNTFDENASKVEEVNNIAMPFDGKHKVSEILEEHYYEPSIEIIDENGTFLGWRKYVYHIRYDEFGDYVGNFVKEDDTLYTTEEILEMEIDCGVEFLAIWSDISEEEYAEWGR